MKKEGTAMKTLKKHWKWAALAAVIVLLIAIFTTWRPVKNPATQEYIVGSGNCQGQVDTARFLAVDDAFAIGADEDGMAVFKNPAKALRALRTHYGEGIWAIQKEVHMIPLTPYTYYPYTMGGWEPTGVTPEVKQQAHFVAGFVDIYENSFQ